MNVRNRHFIKQSEIKELKELISKEYTTEVVEHLIPKKSRVELIETEEGDILYAVNHKLSLWETKDGYLPVLKMLLEKNNKIIFKTIVVDMGAVRYVTNGADIMRPGITKIDKDITKGEIVRIADERNDQTLAIGKAMYDAEEMDSKAAGKVVKNLHTIKDKIWNFEKNFN